MDVRRCPDAGQAGVQLAVGKDRHSQVEYHTVQSEALATIERGGICKAQRKLPTLDGPICALWFEFERDSGQIESRVSLF